MSWLSDLQKQFPEMESFPPASAELLGEAEMTLGPLPGQLRNLYAETNGLRCRSFAIYPVFDPAAPKRTWESIQRMNDPRITDALGGEPDLLERFLVFADIANGFAAIDRQDNSIWFEDGQGELCQTDLGFEEFVALTARNAE